MAKKKDEDKDTRLKAAKLPAESAFYNEQLSLFQGFLCNTADERDRLSNTIELWDAVPKFFVSRKEMSASRDSKGRLDTLRHDFEYQGERLSVSIVPSRITDEDGQEREFYPSAREELVEDALRKIAAEQSFGFFEGSPLRSGVRFSIYLIRKELLKRGHALSFQEVKQALSILNKCNVELSRNGENEPFVSSPIIPVLAGVRAKDLEENPRLQWHAEFHPLITQSIKQKTFRQYDYARMMSHESQLARWLDKRLSHNFINASFMNTYNILFSTIKRDSRLCRYTRERDNIRACDDAFEILKGKMVLLGVAKTEKKGRRGKIEDVLWDLTPHPDFVRQMKAANKRVSVSKNR